MKTYDIVGEIWWDDNGNPTILCADCSQKLNGELGLSDSAIFADDEWNYAPVCDKCNEPLDVKVIC